MKRRLNWKVLTILAAVLLLLGGGGYGVYLWKNSRTAEGLLDQSRQAEEAGRYLEAAELLGNYLAYRPKDQDERARMGMLLEKAGTTAARLQAIEVYARVLRVEPGRQELRRRLVHVAMDLNRFEDARPHLAELLAATTDDAELEHYQGRCAEEARDFETAASWYERARKHAPNKIESYVRLAQVLRQRPEQADQADEVMNDLITANNSSQARLARARYLRQYGTLEAWEKDVVQAQKLAPDEPEVLLARAEIHQARNEWGPARELLQLAIKRDPKNVAYHAALAGVELQCGKLKDAIAGLRRGLEAARDSDTLLELLAEALLDAEETAEAETVIGRLHDRNLPKAGLNYLQARLLMSKGEWSIAAPLLEAARTELAGVPVRAARAAHALGQCHDRLGNTDQAVDAYQKAVALNPRRIASRVALAAALTNARRIDEAIAECEKIAAAPDAPGGGAVLLARGLILRNLRLPPQRQNWKEVDEALTRAERAEPQSAEVVVLRAEALIAQGLLDRARTHLEKARDAKPKEVAYWIALIALSERQGKPEATALLLQQAQPHLGEKAEFVLARLRYWSQLRGAAADAALDQIEKDLSKLPAAHQLRVLAALAEARMLRGERKEAARLWTTLAERSPNDQSAQVRLFDQALSDGDEDAMRRHAAALRKIEGDDGSLWRYAEATLLLHKIRRGNKESLDQAIALKNELAKKRPDWSRTALLAAGLAEQQGDWQSAVESYQQAFRLGDRQTGVVRRLLQLLMEQYRYSEAANVLQGLKDDYLASGDLLRIAAEVSFHTQANVRALELAKQAVSAGSKEYRDHLWLGQLLAGAGKTDEAEAALRRAVELGGQAPGPWVALIECLAMFGAKEKAENALKQAEQKLKPNDAPAALARCYEVLGRTEKAEELHQKSLAAQANNASIIRQAAAFYLRVAQPRKAEPLLRQLLEPARDLPPGERAWARRTLAVLLAQTSNHRLYREALTLTEPNPNGTAENTEDRRARAAVLATRPGRRPEAIRILVELRRRQALPEEDLFMLAQLHEREGDWLSAREVLNALSHTQRANPQYLAHFARGLIRQGKLDEAAQRVEALEMLAPRTLQTIEVKARLLKARGKEKEAVTLLQEQARAKDAPVLAIAALLEELGQATAAEPYYRQMVTGGKPEGTLLLAAFLGRRKQIDAALDLFDQAWKTAPPETVALAAVAMLHTSGITPSQYDRVEQGLQSAFEKNPKLTVLLLHRAGVQELRGRFTDAEATYRQVLAQDASNPVALNNLAWLLAHQKDKGEEALSLINRAIDGVGALPEFLDTRAMVHLNRGDAALAFKDLQLVLQDYPTANRYWRLARIRHAEGNLQAGLTAYRKAMDLGFKPEKLHALERRTFEDVLRELETPVANPEK